MALPTIVLLASVTVTLTGAGPISGWLAQYGLWPPAEARARLLSRPLPSPAPAPAPSPAPSASTQSPAPSRGAAPRKKAAAADVFQVPAGSVMFAQLRTTVSSQTSEMDDEIRATLRDGVTQEGVELVPSGSVMHGKVVDVVPASRQERRGRISVAFYVIQHAATGSRAPIRSRPIVTEAAALDPAVVGRSAAKRPVDVQLPAGEPLIVTLAEPLIVRIPR
jgi:hypothetical protein